MRTSRRRALSTSALQLSGLALLATALAGCVHAGKGETPGSGIHFVSDDFAGALARARAEGKPLFVDAWAPWCHSCVSMKSYVFPDAVLSGVADRFVWLEVDTEKPVNRAFVEQFPTEALPTLMVIDPRTGKAFRRWVGSATVVELAARLRSTALALTPGAPGTPAQSALALASAADATGDHAAATAAYREALAASVPRSLDHAQAVEGLVQRLAQDGDTGGCVELAREAFHVAPGTRSPPSSRPVCPARWSSTSSMRGGRRPWVPWRPGGEPGQGPVGGADGRRPLQPLRDGGGGPARAR